MGHRSPKGSRTGQGATHPLSLDIGSLDISHHKGREDRIAPASCLHASLHGQPQLSGFGPRSWCRFSSCRHRAAGPRGISSKGCLEPPKVDLPWTSWAFITQWRVPHSGLALASDLMTENMGDKGMFHKREGMWLLCWTLGFSPGVWGRAT